MRAEREYVFQGILKYEKRCKIKMIIYRKIQLIFTAWFPGNRKRSQAGIKKKNTKSKLVFPANHGCFRS